MGLLFNPPAQQVLNWVIAAAPGHPALTAAADRIVHNAGCGLTRSPMCLLWSTITAVRRAMRVISNRAFLGRRRLSNHSHRDTLERTGPGPWTDSVLEAFWAGSPAKGTPVGRSAQPSGQGEPAKKKSPKARIHSATREQQK